MWEVSAITCAEHGSFGVLLLLHSRQLCSSGLLIAILHQLSVHISNGTLSSYDALIKDETGVLSAGSQMLCSLC